MRYHTVETTVSGEDINFNLVLDDEVSRHTSGAEYDRTLPWVRISREALANALKGTYQTFTFVSDKMTTVMHRVNPYDASAENDVLVRLQSVLSDTSVDDLYFPLHRDGDTPPFLSFLADLFGFGSPKMPEDVAAELTVVGKAVGPPPEVDYETLNSTVKNWGAWKEAPNPELAKVKGYDSDDHPPRTNYSSGEEGDDDEEAEDAEDVASPAAANDDSVAFSASDNGSVASEVVADDSAEPAAAETDVVKVELTVGDDGVDVDLFLNGEKVDLQASEEATTEADGDVPDNEADDSSKTAEDGSANEADEADADGTDGGDSKTVEQTDNITLTASIGIDTSYFKPTNLADHLREGDWWPMAAVGVGLVAVAWRMGVFGV